MAKEKNSFVLYYETDPEVKIAMRFVSRSLDDNDERYRAKVEKRREAGRKGGLKSAQSRKQKKQNEANQANATKGKQIKLIMNLNLYLIMILIVRGLRPLPARA